MPRGAVVAVTLGQKIRFDFDLLRIEFGTGTGRDGSFDDGGRNLLVLLLLASGRRGGAVVVRIEAAIFAEKVMARRIGGR